MILKTYRLSVTSLCVSALHRRITFIIFCFFNVLVTRSVIVSAVSSALNYFQPIFKFGTNDIGVLENGDALHADLSFEISDSKAHIIIQ